MAAWTSVVVCVGLSAPAVFAGVPFGGPSRRDIKTPSKNAPCVVLDLAGSVPTSLGRNPRHLFKYEIQRLFPDQDVRVVPKANEDCRDPILLKIDFGKRTASAPAKISVERSGTVNRLEHTMSETSSLARMFTCIGLGFAASLCTYPLAPCISCSAMGLVAATKEETDFEFWAEWLLATKKTPGWCWMLSCAWPLSGTFLAFLFGSQLELTSRYEAIGVDIRKAFVEAGILQPEFPPADGPSLLDHVPF